jgi:lactate permease
MTWLQQYNPTGNLAISAILAAIPLFILLYMLGIRRSKGHYAAFFATLAAVLLAIFIWGCRWVTPFRQRCMGRPSGSFPSSGS